MSRVRRLVAVAAVVATGAGVYLLTRSPESPPPLDVSYGDIVKVQAYPVPEGTAPPPILRAPDAGTYARALSEVRSDIPSPFPAPVRCDYSGPMGDGLQLTVELKDGRRLEYFACAFPDSLKSLYDDAWR